MNNTIKNKSAGTPLIGECRKVVISPTKTIYTKATYPGTAMYGVGRHDAVLISGDTSKQIKDTDLGNQLFTNGNHVVTKITSLEFDTMWGALDV